MLDSYRKKLLAIWGIGFIIPFLLIFLQYFDGKYGDKFSETLGWLTALTLSTMTLMFGVMLSNPVNERDETLLATPDDQLNEQKKAAKAEIVKKDSHEKFVYQVVAAFSIVYLLIINLVLFVEPLVSAKPQDLMRDSKIWLAVIDSLLSIGIGFFFGKR